jgi:hypothetical protein
MYSNHYNVYDQNNLNMEKLGPQLHQLSQNLINKYPVLISQNTIDNALEEFYDGIRKILGKAAKMRKTYPTRPTWRSDKIERRRKVYLQKKNMLYKNTDPIRKNHLAQEMIQAKEKFKNEIITTQERAWSKFVESDLGPNPGGVIQGLSELADQNNTVKSSSSGNKRKNILKNPSSLDFKIRTFLIDQSRVDIKLP